MSGKPKGPYKTHTMGELALKVGLICELAVGMARRRNEETLEEYVPCNVVLKQLVNGLDFVQLKPGSQTCLGERGVQLRDKAVSSLGFKTAQVSIPNPKPEAQKKPKAPKPKPNPPRPRNLTALLRRNRRPRSGSEATRLHFGVGLLLWLSAITLLSRR